jgi:hypothetical protein
MDKAKILIFGIGILIGLLIYDRLLKPEVQIKTVYTETIKTDTVFVTKTEVINQTKDSIITVYERDTVVLDFKPKIKGFERTFYLSNGNIQVNGEVLGELTKMGLTSNLKIPTITNTITKDKTTTIIKKPVGIYLTGSIDSRFNYSLGATYLKSSALIGYEYDLVNQIHSAKVGFKVF